MAAVNASELDNRKPRAAGLERRGRRRRQLRIRVPLAEPERTIGRRVPCRTMNEAEPGL